MAEESTAPVDKPMVLYVEDLAIEFSTGQGTGRAVEGVSFEIRAGETLALVGESGSGKSVTSLAIMGLLPDSARIASGRVWLGADELLSKSSREMRAVRGREIAMVLQDPLGALNPAFTIGHQIIASLRLHTDLSGKALRARAIELLQLMRIADAEKRLDSYPHQFSGGMRQRVVSAIALSGEPRVLIADEPTTALDVTVQAAYLELLEDIRGATGLGILFITHDLSVVEDIADHVVVMYAGEIVETAVADELFARPQHPYTKALLESVPKLDGSTARLASIAGFPPSIYTPMTGCKFRERCWLYEQLGRPDACANERPSVNGSAAVHQAACHFVDEAVAGHPSAEPDTSPV